LRGCEKPSRDGERALKRTQQAALSGVSLELLGCGCLLAELERARLGRL